MILEPQFWAPEDYVRCIHCNKPYNFRVGGILWQGDQDKPGFKETLICGKCLPEVIPGLLKDFIGLERSMYTDKRRLQYLIDAGEKAKFILNLAD